MANYRDASPPNDDPDVSGEVQKARMAQGLRGFFVSVVVRDDPPESSKNWYTFRYTLYCGPLNVYQLWKESRHGAHHTPPN